MKNFHQNLLIILALALCALCVWQSYGQTMQRNQIDSLNLILSQKLAAIQSYTNSNKTMDDQIAQMDARITELKTTVKTNDDFILSQKRAINKLEAENGALTNQAGQYKTAIEAVQAKLKEAYEGVQKQNDAIKQLVAQRDEFVQKLNDSVKDRNAIVDKYNALVARVEQSQGTLKPPDK